MEQKQFILTPTKSPVDFNRTMQNPRGFDFNNSAAPQVNNFMDTTSSNQNGQQQRKGYYNVRGPSDQRYQNQA